MKSPAASKRFWLATILALGVAQAAGAQDIYKCTHGGQVEYTDHPCQGGKGELLHQASDGEIIGQYLDLGQDGLAKRYADSHHLDTLYQQLFDARKEKLAVRAQQQADEAAAAQQRDADARQQSLMLYAARLQGENDALRQQNDAYIDQPEQPAYGYAPVYWGAITPYWHHDREPHRPPPPPPPPKSVFQTHFSPAAGGRTKE